MDQKRVMRGFLSILLIFLSLQSSWIKVIENKDKISLDNQITGDKTKILLLN